MKKRISEADLAARVVAHLREQGWDVYQEVQVRTGSNIADIVAVVDHRIWIIECKTCMGAAVLEQALRWQGSAHHVSVAVPPFALLWFSVCRHLGIGVLEVGREITEPLRPMVVRRPGAATLRGWTAKLRRMKASLHPAQRDALPAGTAAGTRVTPWSLACLEVRRYVAQHPGCTLAEVLSDRGAMHYHSLASARSAMAKWIRHGSVPGVRCEAEGRTLRLYPEEVRR